MQRNACLISLVLVAFACAGAVAAGPHRSLRTLIKKGVVVQATEAAAPVSVSGGKSITIGSLTVSKGVQAAPAPAPAPRSAPTPAPAPGAGAPAPAPTSAPVNLPRGAPVTGSNDIGQALQCQSAFNARGGRSGVEAALGAVCKQGDAAFDALGCCQATAKLLNSGNLNKCACNNLVYQQLCQEVKVQDLTCDTLRPTLVGCGLQC